MDNEKNEGLKVEDISVDKSSIKRLSLKEQIIKLAQNRKIATERKNARSILDELEAMSKENKESKLDEIDVGTIIVASKDDLKIDKTGNDRGERD